MVYNIQSSVFARIANISLASSKDIIAIAEDRESALAAKSDIIAEIEAYDHIDTGRMINSISVSSIGGGEFAIKAVDYAKYVNGYDREATGAGFIDDAIANAQLDGYDVEVAV
jgi:hypothetical protein